MTGQEEALAAILRSEMTAAYKSHVRNMRGDLNLTERADHFVDHTIDTFLDVLASHVRQQQAQAWDEGRVATLDQLEWPTTLRTLLNPYLKEDDRG